MKELNAINSLLGIIGEAPIDSLSDVTVNEITDSCMAKRTLDEVNTDVQSEGWDWNTDRNVRLIADSSGHYLFQQSTLGVRFSPNRYPNGEFIRRGLRVYDKDKQTFEIGEYRKEPIIVDEVIRLIPWDEIPHVAQQYMMIRAGRIFSNRYINSNSIYVYTAQDEEYARAMLIRGEERSSQHNLLWGNDRGMGHGNSYIPAEGTFFRSN